MHEPKITHVRITDLVGMFTMPTVYVRFDNQGDYTDGTDYERLYDFYPDEIRFTCSEFVGLTKAEAITLKHQKDLAYLRS